MSDTEACVAALRGGAVVAAPTDTFHGLLADPFSTSAMSLLQRLKQATEIRPWPLLIPSAYELGRLQCTMSEAGRRLASLFWPGQVTLVVACRGALAQRVGRASDGAVGLRVPKGPQGLLELLALWDGPLTGTSANPHGKSPAKTAEEVYAYFAEEIEYVLPGLSPGGAASTVVDTVVEPCVIEREGAVSGQQIMEALR